MLTRTWSSPPPPLQSRPLRYAKHLKRWGVGTEVRHFSNGYPLRLIEVVFGDLHHQRLWRGGMRDYKTMKSKRTILDIMKSRDVIHQYRALYTKTSSSPVLDGFVLRQGARRRKWRSLSRREWRWYWRGIVIGTKSGIFGEIGRKLTMEQRK